MDYWKIIEKIGLVIGIIGGCFYLGEKLKMEYFNWLYEYIPIALLLAVIIQAISFSKSRRFLIDRHNLEISTIRNEYNKKQINMFMDILLQQFHPLMRYSQKEKYYQGSVFDIFQELGANKDILNLLQNIEQEYIAFYRSIDEKNYDMIKYRERLNNIIVKIQNVASDFENNHRKSWNVYADLDKITECIRQYDYSIQKIESFYADMFGSNIGYNSLWYFLKIDKWIMDTRNIQLPISISRGNNIYKKIKDLK